MHWTTKKDCMKFILHEGSTSRHSVLGTVLEKIIIWIDEITFYISRGLMIPQNPQTKENIKARKAKGSNDTIHKSSE